jgi:hypothetical protein
MGMQEGTVQCPDRDGDGQKPRDRTRSRQHLPDHILCALVPRKS